MVYVRGERLPAAFYALVPNLKKGVLFCHRRVIEIFCRLFSTHQPPNVFYQTPGRRPPHITGRHVNTAVILLWGGACKTAEGPIHPASPGFRVTLKSGCLIGTRKIDAILIRCVCTFGWFVPCGERAGGDLPQVFHPQSL